MWRVKKSLEKLQVIAKKKLMVAIYDFFIWTCNENLNVIIWRIMSGTYMLRISLKSDNVATI